MSWVPSLQTSCPNVITKWRLNSLSHLDLLLVGAEGESVIDPPDGEPGRVGYFGRSEKK